MTDKLQSDQRDCASDYAECDRCGGWRRLIAVRLRRLCSTCAAWDGSVETDEGQADD